jgi:hypothetical protein
MSTLQDALKEAGGDRDAQEWISRALLRTGGRQGLQLLVGAASIALFDPFGLATGLAHLGQGTLGQAWLDALYLTLYGGVLFWLLARPSPAGVRLGR